VDEHFDGLPFNNKFPDDILDVSFPTAVPVLLPNPNRDRYPARPRTSPSLLPKTSTAACAAKMIKESSSFSFLFDHEMAGARHNHFPDRFYSIGLLFPFCGSPRPPC